MPAKPKSIFRARARHEYLLRWLILLAFFAGVVSSGSVSVHGQQTSNENDDHNSQSTVPTRPDSPLYKGEQGNQQSEIKFATLTRAVTIKLHVEDPNGYFLPNIRRENFAVYEDGVRQKNVSVEVEHSPVSIALLMEGGSRYHEVNKLLGDEMPYFGRELLDVLIPADKIAVFKYDSNLQTLAELGPYHKDLDGIFHQLSTPDISEANFYDALLETMNRMKNISGRKAIIAISSGVDTFSKTNFQEVLRTAQDCATPIYTIGLAVLMQRESAVYGPSAPFARIDWDSAEKQMETLTKASGGRAYAVESAVGIAGIYDDIMENLRVRYEVSYVSSNPATVGPPRKIQVELIDPQTGQQLKIRDSNGRVIAAKVFVQESYMPDAAPGK
jgi:Ca-activated chloride channel homolog